MRRHLRKRRGIALLLCIFVAAVTSILLLGILESQRIEMQTVTNVVESERANFMAEAAIHEIKSRLLTSSAWRGKTGWRRIPGDAMSTFHGSVRDVSGGKVEITGIGRVGEITKQKRVVVDPTK